ncbi:MAG: DUF2309 domain-containing protein [Pirellulales bacterium]|nr:DUF2309 domain-containing protein [Pirellulales bacterium]
MADGKTPFDTAFHPGAAVATPPARSLAASDRHADLEHAIEHAAHLLPTQAPIQVFVHHNTLHAFEHLSFAEGVERGGRTYGCRPYLREEDFHAKLESGRILREDLSAVLVDDLADSADRLIGFLGTRYRLRLAMLEHPLRHGPDAELRWWIAETDALRRFRPEVAQGVREQMINRTRHWVMRDLRVGRPRSDEPIRTAAATLIERFGSGNVEQWDTGTWEAFTLHLLWHICRRGVRDLPIGDQSRSSDDSAANAAQMSNPVAVAVRHRDLMLAATGLDSDRLVNEVLIRFCAPFLDQGLAAWQLPAADDGFLASFSALYANSHPVEPWLRELPAELARIATARLRPLELIAESLQVLGVPAEEQDSYLERTLLALRGWAGMLWQMETNAEWAARPAPRGTLVEYMAVRLLLERLAIAHLARECDESPGDLGTIRVRLRQRAVVPAATSEYQRAFVIFQLAQTIGWHPPDLWRLTPDEWLTLIKEIEAFNDVERRRVYQLAFERRYRNQALDAWLAHAPHARPTESRPRFQVICCIDEREESFRRHLEEVAPPCETFGVAGFFGVAMYYRGLAEAHYVPLCPVVVKPRHFVQEEVVYSFEQSHRRRSETRRVLGHASHRLHTESRSVLGGAIAALLGSLASIPLVARVLFPRLTAQVRRLFGQFVQPPPITRLSLERTGPEPGPANGQLGYSVDEMTDIAQRVLEDIGLTARFSRLVIIVGHGSSSLNNPHESAHDCGACGGGRGGPNARAFSFMLNDARVRYTLAERGLNIPRETVFVGAYHNTCDESMRYYDLDRLPSSHRDDFETAKAAIDEARRRNAHERCRRFESAEMDLSPEAALRHVEGRAEDLSQVRPEYGHATNAICYVGRRWRTRGLFLDRRTFLASYDPMLDDDSQRVLTRILQAVIPVCAGINLEYYFSFVDPSGYGCDTKLPHNITSLLGVMDGAASDLRSGLPWQMVEIHEPVRIVFVIETTPEAMLRILARNPSLSELVERDWVQLAVLAPDAAVVQLYRGGRFEPYDPETTELPVVGSSDDWYRGWRDHLGFASVVPESCGSIAAASEPRA